MFSRFPKINPQNREPKKSKKVFPPSNELEFEEIDVMLVRLSRHRVLSKFQPRCPQKHTLTSNQKFIDKFHRLLISDFESID